jgi:elongation factor Ts
MAEISAAAVKALRDRTNAPMMDCKKALIAAGGDMDKAVQILREQNKAIGGKKAEREAAEGRIAVYTDPAAKVAAIVELRCESAPSAKNELFVQLANDLARQVALKGATTPDELLAQPFVDDPSRTVSDRIHDVIGLIRENMKPARMRRLTGLTGSYVHHDGTVGVLVQAEGERADPQLLRDVAMHVTAVRPAYARREDVPADVVARETEIARSQIAADPRNAKKPANIIEKIAEGKLKTWFAENVLVEQPFVKDDKKTVGELLDAAGLRLGEVVRYKVGELS